MWHRENFRRSSGGKCLSWTTSIYYRAGNSRRAQPYSLLAHRSQISCQTLTTKQRCPRQRGTPINFQLRCRGSAHPKSQPPSSRCAVLPVMLAAASPRPSRFCLWRELNIPPEVFAEVDERFYYFDSGANWSFPSSVVLMCKLKVQNPLSQLCLCYMTKLMTTGQ